MGILLMKKPKGLVKVDSLGSLAHALLPESGILSEGNRIHFNGCARLLRKTPAAGSIPERIEVIASYALPFFLTVGEEKSDKDRSYEFGFLDRKKRQAGSLSFIGNGNWEEGVQQDSFSLLVNCLRIDAPYDVKHGEVRIYGPNFGQG